MTRDINDPRVANVLAQLDNWRKYDEEHEEQIGDAVPRYIDQLLDGVAWNALPLDKLRAFIVTLANVVDDESLDAMSAEANDERRIYLECTIGNDIGKALQQCGLNPRQAEVIAHRAIGEALEQRRGKAAETQEAARAETL